MGFFKTIPRELEEAALVDGALGCERLRTASDLAGNLTVSPAFSLCVGEFIYASFITTRRTDGLDRIYTERPATPSLGALMAATSSTIPLALFYNLSVYRRLHRRSFR